MLQILDFGRSDQDLHHKSNNYKFQGIGGDDLAWASFGQPFSRPKYFFSFLIAGGVKTKILKILKICIKKPYTNRKLFLGFVLYQYY